MSDRLTSVSPVRGIRTPAGHAIPGLADHGRKTRAEMIEYFRRHYQWQLEEAQAALALTDDQLTVQTYLGAWAQKNKQEVTK